MELKAAFSGPSRRSLERLVSLLKCSERSIEEAVVSFLALLPGVVRGLLDLLLEEV
jgi:hypothetical protein